MFVIGMGVLLEMEGRDDFRRCCLIDRELNIDSSINLGPILQKKNINNNQEK